MRKYLIAPNAFKHALSATLAAESVARGILKADPEASCMLFPVGDGGDGTGDLILQHRGGSLCETQSLDPLGRLRTASYGLIDGGRTAVIELASASGLRLLKDEERDPMAATTFGTGTLIRDALDKEVGKVLICVGGSATVDGGLGILRALGIRFYDDKGKEVTTPSGLQLLARVDTTAMHKRCSEAEFVVLCDVRNPLTGPNGAAAVFGPQKGADQGMLELLGKGLEKLSDLVKEGKGFDMGQTPFGGAAGGAAAGLQAFLGAELVSGIECFLDLTGFDEALQEADVVVTGEGSLDAQTFEGKAPFGVAARAKQKGRRVVCLAGRITQDVQAVSGPFDVIMDINDGEGSLEEALRNTAFNLERVGSTIASLQA